MTDVTTENVAAPKKPSAIMGWIKAILLIRESWVGTIGAIIVGGFFLTAILAPLISPYDPNVNLQPFTFPLGTADADITLADGTVIEKGSRFWLGTDIQGRDILSRIIWGGQRVLFYATMATLCAYIVGILMGLYAGYYRGWVDEVISFIANVILSFPIMVLYVLIIAKLGASGANIILAVVFASSPGIMRIVRGLALDIATREYITAAETRGESALYVCIVEILPNSRGPLIVDFCLRMGYTTITIGALGFLGLGLPPPDPDWGGMIAENRGMVTAGFPYMAIIPAITVSLLVLGFNMLADGMREVAIRD